MNIQEGTGEQNPNIIELSKYLAVNALCHSIDDPQKAYCDPILQPKLDSKYNFSRNILIIGAGVSNNANPTIPLARTFAKKLIRDFNQRFSTIVSLQETVLGRELDFLSRAYNLNPNEFETIMLACSHFDRREVLLQLIENYDLKHVPNLFFEVVGHLFKHRFIDVIIDFNFDEILANVIEDEMKPPEYHYILSDGDIGDDLESFMIGHRLKKPIYMKPHGTISHPSSLRFDKKQYFLLPEKIADLLKMLFQARYEFPGKKGYLDLNIITAGFGMQSTDLNFLLNKALEFRKNKAAFNLFTFDPGDKYLYFKTLQEVGYFRGQTIAEAERSKKQTGETLHFIKVNPEIKLPNDTRSPNFKNDSLESLYYRLWQSIDDRFLPKQTLRNIRRHLIISQLFQNKNEIPIRIFKGGEQVTFRPGEEINPEQIYRSEFYLIAKIYLEIALLLVHADGLINITQLRETSINKYFGLLQRFYATLAKTSDKPKKNMTMRDLVTAFGMSDYKGFAKDTFIYSGFNMADGGTSYRKNIVDKLLFLLKKLRKIFKGEKTVINDSIFNKEGRDLLLFHFEEFSKNNVWQIKSKFEDYNISKFSSISHKNLLHTDLRYRTYLNRFLQDNQSNVVLSVTKSINFLSGILDDEQIISDLFKKGKDKHLILILGNSQIDEIESVINNQIETTIPKGKYNIQPYKLHWTLHNQHLHLFMRLAKNGKTEFIKIEDEFDANKAIGITRLKKLDDRLNKLTELRAGIYYNRRMLSRKINPIFFESQEDNPALVADLTELLDGFINYLARSGAFEAKSNASIPTGNSHAVTDYKYFLKYKIRLFRNLFERL